MPLDQVLHDEISTFGCIFAHIKLECLGYALDNLYVYVDKTHVITDKLTEFLWRYLPQPFKSSDFRIAQIFQGVGTFLFTVTIPGHLFVTYPEKRRFQEHSKTKSLRQLQKNYNVGL